MVSSGPRESRSATSTLVALRALATALRSQNLTLDAALNTMIHGLAMFDRKLDLAVSNAPHAALYGIPETRERIGKALAGTLAPAA